MTVGVAEWDCRSVVDRVWTRGHGSGVWVSGWGSGAAGLWVWRPVWVSGWGGGWLVAGGDTFSF
jgi:hypothetical protein